MTLAIEITSLHKTYPRTWKGPPFEALKGVSLCVPEGEVFGFVGPNGAGKSTTIKILTGVMRASLGSVRLFGLDAALPEARKGLGYVPENPSLPDYLTPLEVLRMTMGLHGFRPEQPQRHCMEWLERFGLGEVSGKVIRGFSKGMAQRTALANALVASPRLLILDEPLSGLDPIGRRDVVDILSNYCRGGGTLFFTSHVLHDVERIAHRYGLINQGRLTAVQSPAELAGTDDRVAIRSRGDQPLDGLREEAPGRWFIEVPAKDLWQMLDALRLSGHVLIEVRPVLSLEAAFLHAVSTDEKFV
jgi:ABC-2 type transport system ATP-binding protein